MKVHHTKYKPRYEAYILDTVTDYEGNELPNRQAKVERLFERFWQEKNWQVERDGIRVAMIDWLQGLALPIAYTNVDIVELAVKMGSIDPAPSDELFDRVVDNYWSFMANIILGMEPKQ